MTKHTDPAAGDGGVRQGWFHKDQPASNSQPESSRQEAAGPLPPRGRSVVDRLRTGEIVRIIRHDHDAARRDGGHSDTYVVVVRRSHIAVLAESLGHVADRAFSLECWLRRAGTPIPPAVLARIVADNPARRRRAAWVGRMLGLTAATRDALNVRTIRPVDLTAAQMAACRRAKARERERQRRKAAGAVPREQSLSRTRPWEAEGISRSTWERRRRAAVTQIRAQYSFFLNAHEIASPGGAARPAKRKRLSSKAVRHTAGSTGGRSGGSCGTGGRGGGAAVTPGGAARAAKRLSDSGSGHCRPVSCSALATAALAVAATAALRPVVAVEVSP
jgi:uncharacterized membrane protein